MIWRLAYVVTVFTIFVLSTNFDIQQAMPSSIFYPFIKVIG